MIARVLRFLRLWPGPTRPIGGLTNAEIDALDVPDSCEDAHVTTATSTRCIKCGEDTDDQRSKP